MPLLPERQLLVSPQLAATLGLEEALLYQLLGDFMAQGEPQMRNNFQWLSIDASALQKLLPFWQPYDIRRILGSLRDKGVLLIGAHSFTNDREFQFAFNETPRARSPDNPPAPVSRMRQPIDRSWQPEPDLLRQLAQYGIPHQFSLEQVPEFVTYWQERGEPQHSWSSKFLKQVLRLWREQETRDRQLSREVRMAANWRPSADALEILVRQAGINRNFVEDAIPEFILYWQERGDRRSTWNTDFVRHVKRQWARFRVTLEHDSDPHLLPGDWQPNEDLFEVLQLANIPRSFAEQQLPEFILYWRESGQALSSWNTKFLQHIKRQWARHSAPEGNGSNERQQNTGQPLSTRDRSLVDDLTDRSWAN